MRAQHIAGQGPAERSPRSMSQAREKAELFWRGAAADDGLRKADPRKALLNFLIGKSTAIGDPAVYIKYIAAIWNAYFEDRRITNIRPIDLGKIGVTILGTKYRAEDISRRPRPITVGQDMEVEARP